MRATNKLLALAFTAALQPAMAGVVSLDFEDIQQDRQLAAYDGVTFSGSAWGVRSSAPSCGGFDSFLRTGSCGALELALDATADPVLGSQSFVMSLAGGFVNEFSFVYSAQPGSAVTIQLFDGAGHELQSLTGLKETGCSIQGIRFCNWTTTSMKFDGIALSLKVTGADQGLLLDDLSFNQPAAGGTVPEPASIALALGALGAAAWTRRRAAR
ncbi:PEP-CTERM sorting domain-containing protein [Roseateles saccharophilus]|uniref:Putative secreted protein with PEP-CTERM sorting signal n=1 Tax=Roseateles saccharophilus TaxID=304 RepID=A0A4R3VDZ7_ROSSA|nr:PEP-CTERM sorting domain-containing protein [Roseateles saccharophilus]TCV02143.1 putative secreted protein with PEP-CTERM sorting signal [Roseateles saccharophilus]